MDVKVIRLWDKVLAGASLCGETLRGRGPLFDLLEKYTPDLHDDPGAVHKSLRWLAAGDLGSVTYLDG